MNGTLYRQFAIVGGTYTIGAIAAAAVLAVVARRSGAGFGWAVAGATCLAVAFVMWLAIVNPVNLRVAEAHHFCAFTFALWRPYASSTECDAVSSASLRAISTSAW